MSANPVQVTINLNPAMFGETTAKSAAIIREVANTAARYAKESSPYLTGHNRSSITMDETPGKSGDVPGFSVYTQSGYGAFLELGTKRRAARPYIMPGIRRSIQEAEARKNA